MADDELLEELLDAEADLARCRRAQARAEVLQAQLAAEQTTCQALRERLDAERNDVRRASGRSVRSMLARIRGKRDDVLRVERAELATAEAELAAHVAAMQRLSARFVEARDEGLRVAEARANLESAIERREREIAASGDARARKLRDLDVELGLARATHDEIRSARHAAIRASGALAHAIDTLSVAENWSVADALSEGSGGVRYGSTRFAGDWAGRAKHDQLDASVVPIAEAHAALLQLRAELTDTASTVTDDPDSLQRALHHPNLRMPSSGLGSLDVWFDNAFSDLMVHDRITSSISELRRAARSVEELLAELDPRDDAVGVTVAQLETERERLLRD
jgi:hypothetical protein